MKNALVFLALSMVVLQQSFASTHLTKTSNVTSHQGDHFHNGKMMNHANPKGMTNKELKAAKLKERAVKK